LQITNTSQTYGLLSIALHWLTALLVFITLPLGWYANQIPIETSHQIAEKALFFSWHKSTGIAAFIVALLRILWNVCQTRPSLYNANKPAEALLAGMMHWLLYISLIAVPLTGWISHAASAGYAPILWPLGQNLPLIPKNDDISNGFAQLHIISKWIFVSAIVLHTAAGLKHHFWDRDSTLLRMLSIDHAAPMPPKQTRSRLSVPIVCALWITLIGIGIFMMDNPANEPLTQTVISSQQTEPKSDNGNWTMQNGELGLTVQQFGITLNGGFEEWSTTIQFIPRDTIGTAGEVNVTISTGSLKIGSVTDYAVGEDFLDSDTFPEAYFHATIERVPTGYVAAGPLVIRNQSVNVMIPLNVKIDNDIATATGTLDVQRLDFGIGANYPDDSTVSLKVRITFSISATHQ